VNWYCGGTGGGARGGEGGALPKGQGDPSHDHHHHHRQVCLFFIKSTSVQQGPGPEVHLGIVCVYTQHLMFMTAS
jgi:hypothetical protein